MRILVVHAHPVAASFNRALFHHTVERLMAAGHEVDALDLYAEDFDPRLTSAEREAYHDLEKNCANVSAHVERLLAADALVLVYPVWNYGFPAILKGWFDRVFVPGVSFALVNGQVSPTLHNIRKLVVVTTYGGTRFRTWLMGDPPRKLIGRMLRALIKPGAPVSYLAHYNLNLATDQSRAAFMARVGAVMDRF
ncbi:NAD(P)H-dependent oxidoreductase [uncultured Hoeflea sp.]|uniref:NAD(P)H-dependent oxidoreductase n=1 Tax=uncultured Hoeflea sp. TaxID=538666 RepID=UPI0026246679|nr:NAD(P)H-dependent oxidoreductase [uncultured Hoeflea sp.]